MVRIGHWEENTFHFVLLFVAKCQVSYLTKINLENFGSPVRVAQLGRASSSYGRVAGLISGQSTCKGQPTNL